MLIKGLQKTTLLDFPGKVACTVFTGGCNFRCPFCHNASLVTRLDDSDTLSWDEVFAYIKKRKGILDGVCITGGEPLLQPDLEDVCRLIHQEGLSVKLDTNGAYPDRLQTILQENMVDYIAMDIKNSKEEYARTCGLALFPAGVESSVEIIRQSGIPYEFRTTVVREFHSEQSMRDLAQWIAGAERYFLQSFTDSGDLIGNGLSSYGDQEMQRLLDVVLPWVPNARLRGI